MEAAQEASVNAYKTALNEGNDEDVVVRASLLVLNASPARERHSVALHNPPAHNPQPLCIPSHIPHTPARSQELRRRMKEHGLGPAASIHLSAPTQVADVAAWLVTLGFTEMLRRAPKKRAAAAAAAVPSPNAERGMLHEMQSFLIRDGQFPSPCVVYVSEDLGAKMELLAYHDMDFTMYGPGMVPLEAAAADRVMSVLHLRAAQRRDKEDGKEVAAGEEEAEEEAGDAEVAAADNRQAASRASTSTGVPSEEKEQVKTPTAATTVASQTDSAASKPASATAAGGVPSAKPAVPSPYASVAAVDFVEPNGLRIVVQRAATTSAGILTSPMPGWDVGEAVARAEDAASSGRAPKQFYSQLSGLVVPCRHDPHESMTFLRLLGFDLYSMQNEPYDWLLTTDGQVIMAFVPAAACPRLLKPALLYLSDDIEGSAGKLQRALGVPPPSETTTNGYGTLLFAEGPAGVTLVVAGERNARVWRLAWMGALVILGALVVAFVLLALSQVEMLREGASRMQRVLSGAAMHAMGAAADGLGGRRAAK
jgi:hypothetical protein